MVGVKCECSDPGCAMHKGTSDCPRTASYTVYRTDMEDGTGTVMCYGCMSDAMDSGVSISASIPYFYEPENDPADE